MAPYGHKRCLGITQFFLEKALMSQRASRVKKNSGNTFVLMATLNPKPLPISHFPIPCVLWYQWPFNIVYTLSEHSCKKKFEEAIKVGWRRVQASFSTLGGEDYLVSHFFPHKYHSSATLPHGWLGTAPSSFHHVLSQSVWPNWPPKWLGCFLATCGCWVSTFNTQHITLEVGVLRTCMWSSVPHTPSTPTPWVPI